ncbi:nucleoside recognition domain-containing protein [Campylobacter sp.]|uniref:nucleoside recognition domain-containing protein n=1 Tax=Campylobacter sp. TaxID=205 RepID=UPI002AA7C6FB|nr:nucleoside recognition domain-containing protein [Campylobacter sp.]MCI7582598.1 hypothetical protein [Campylobacter sp.]
MAIYQPYFCHGFEWRQSVSLLTWSCGKRSGCSRCVLYPAGEGLMRLALSSKLKEAMNEQTALAFILFAMFYNSCLAATMVFRREAGGGGMCRGYLFLPLWWLIFALLAKFWFISFYLVFFASHPLVASHPPFAKFLGVRGYFT